MTMSDAETNRIIGTLQAFKEQQTRQIDTLFDKINEIKDDTASLKTDFALQKQDIKELKENGCARGENHDKAIERIKQEMMDKGGAEIKNGNGSEVTLFGGKLLCVKNVKLTGRDIVLFILAAGVLMVWAEKFKLLEIFK